MDMNLHPDLEAFIRDQVKQGLYPTPAEVVTEALYLLWGRTEAQHQKLEALRRDVRIGIDEADAGELTDGEAVLARLEAEARRLSGR